MTQQERLRYLVEGLVAEYKEKHNEHIEGWMMRLMRSKRNLQI